MKTLICLLALLCLAFGVNCSAAASADGDFTSTALMRVLQRNGTRKECRAVFDSFDRSLNDGRGYSDCSNTSGLLAWAESYLMNGYVDMYLATSDTAYLRKLTAHFDRVLANRDDVIGAVDTYTSRSMAGWGSSSYARNGAKWHVFIVHTGMITNAPADFVRLVLTQQALQAEFGTSAALYRKKIQECIADAEEYWRDGPGKDEGYYVDPVFELLPLNQQNAMGRVLLTMYQVTGNEQYRNKAERLARFMKKRLRSVPDGSYDWAYWPKASEDGPGSEDISHASINVDFAARCAAAGIVFTSQDVERFALAWLRHVVRPDGTWARDPSSTGTSEKYMPATSGRWLSLIPLLKPSLQAELYADVRRAFTTTPFAMPSGAGGMAMLLLYDPEANKGR